MMTSGGKRNPAKLDLGAGTWYGRWRTNSAFLSWSSVYATVPFRLLAHADEDAARRRYPRFAPMSTTILAFHKTAGISPDGRVRLLVERHGSLAISDLRPILARLGFELCIAPSAKHRLLQRHYRHDASTGGL